MIGNIIQPATAPQLRECPGCGFVQTIPPLMPGVTARCLRCSTVLRHNSTHRPEHIIALAIAAFVLLVVMCSTNLMTVEKAGITRIAGLFSGPQELVQHNMAVLGAVIVFVTVVAPLCRLIALIYVLVRSRKRRRRAIFAACSRSPNSCVRGR